MLQISDYDLFIFDCDGVILDSNRLKINAMRKALESLHVEVGTIDKCIKYFKMNFGKSRFHHIEVFCNQYISKSSGCFSQELLKTYSSQCKSLYLKADITPGFLELINKISVPKYVASGSEQVELRSVFSERGLDQLFSAVYGSPTSKADNVNYILSNEDFKSAVLIGDAISDMEAAKSNGIDFIAYVPFSNVKEKLTNEAFKMGSKVISDWKEFQL